MEGVFETLETSYVEMTTTLSPKLFNLFSIKTFSIPLIVIMAPNINIFCINTKFNSIKPVPFKYQRTSNLHNLKKYI